MDDRHPISTAPRDGTVILVSADGIGEFPMRWNPTGTNTLFQPREQGIWEEPLSRFTWSEVKGCGPTHWRHVKDGPHVH